MISSRRCWSRTLRAGSAHELLGERLAEVAHLELPVHVVRLGAEVRRLELDRVATAVARTLLDLLEQRPADPAPARVLRDDQVRDPHLLGRVVEAGPEV